jgi:hypothetical protein
VGSQVPPLVVALLEREQRRVHISTRDLASDPVEFGFLHKLKPEASVGLQSYLAAKLNKIR